MAGKGFAAARVLPTVAAAQRTGCRKRQNRYWEAAEQSYSVVGLKTRKDRSHSPVAGLQTPRALKKYRTSHPFMSFASVATTVDDRFLQRTDQQSTAFADLEHCC